MRYKLTVEVELTVDPIAEALASRDLDGGKGFKFTLAQALCNQVEGVAGQLRKITQAHIDISDKPDPLPHAACDSYGIGTGGEPGWGKVIKGNMRYVLFRVE